MKKSSLVISAIGESMYNLELDNKETNLLISIIGESTLNFTEEGENVAVDILRKLLKLKKQASTKQGTE